MNAIFEYLINLSASQRLMWVGTAGMAISAISTGIMGYQVAENMTFIVFGVSTILSLAGWWGSLQDKKMAFTLRMEDAKLREKKLDAGLKPELDKTIIKNWEE